MRESKSPREYDKVARFMKKKDNLDKWFFTSDIAKKNKLNWDRTSKIMETMVKMDKSLIKSRTKLNDWNRSATVWKMRSD